MTNQPDEAGARVTPYDAEQICNSACCALLDGSRRLNSFPGLLKRVIQERLWQRRQVPGHGIVELTSFETFVTAAPRKGWGASMATIRAVCRDDPEALDLLDQACRHEHGGDRRSEETKRNNVTLERPPGNTRANALRRLRDDRPDLHASVLAGDMTPHAAMVKAGFRRKTITVPTELERAAKVLVKHFGRDELLRAIAAVPLVCPTESTSTGELPTSRPLKIQRFRTGHF